MKRDPLAAPRRFDRRTWLLGSSCLVLGTVGCRQRDANPPSSFVPGRIAGHSMAPHFLGPHEAVVCQRCQAVTEVELDDESHREFVCPQCGVRQPKSPTATPNLGDRVRLQLWDNVAPLDSLVKRFDVVAFSADHAASDSSPDAWLIKRILGLPGEELSFRSGDLYINNEIVRKSWHQQLDQRILVHDDAPLAGALIETPIGWRSDQAGAWIRTPQGWRSNPAESVASRLTYHHRRCVMTADGEVPAAPVEDTLAYSQWKPRRLNPVNDLMLVGQLRSVDPSRVRCGLAAGNQWLEVVLDFSQQRIHLQTPSAGESLEFEARLPSDSWIDFALSGFDRCVTLVMGQQVVAQIPFEQNEPLSRSDYPTEPAWWEVTEGSLEIRNLSIHRDLHWVGPYGDEPQWSLGRPLGPDEYFLVGDHLAESIDCRVSGRGVNLQAIRGLVVGNDRLSRE